MDSYPKFFFYVLELAKSLISPPPSPLELLTNLQVQEELRTILKDLEKEGKIEIFPELKNFLQTFSNPNPTSADTPSDGFSFPEPEQIDDEETQAIDYLYKLGNFFDDLKTRLSTREQLINFHNPDQILIFSQLNELLKKYKNTKPLLHNCVALMTTALLEHIQQIATEPTQDPFFPTTYELLLELFRSISSSFDAQNEKGLSSKLNDFLSDLEELKIQDQGQDDFSDV